MPNTWYARPVLAVRDAAAAVDFYVAKLGFVEDWRHEEDNRLRIVQVSREGCELILSDQWPDEAGAGRIFISLDASGLAALEAELAERRLESGVGWWGYDLVTLQDPDGNRLWFPRAAP